MSKKLSKSFEILAKNEKKLTKIDQMSTKPEKNKQKQLSNYYELSTKTEKISANLSKS